MTVCLVKNDRFGRMIASEARLTCKSGHEPKTVSLESARPESRFEKIDDLMERFDQIDNLFAA